MQSQKFRNILFKRIEMYGIDGKEDRVSFFASVARWLPRVKSPSGYACRSTQRSLLGTPIDILVMRVNNCLNKPFSYYFYNNSIVLLFPLEYLFKYLRRSFESSQISVARIRVTRPYRKFCCHPNTGVVAVNVIEKEIYGLYLLRTAQLFSEASEQEKNSRVNRV